MHNSFPINRVFNAGGATKFTLNPKDLTVNCVGAYTGNGCEGLYPDGVPPLADSAGRTFTGNSSWPPVTVGTSCPLPVGGVNAAAANSLLGVGQWLPTNAAEAFLKIQYTSVEVRCAISRKMIPVGSPVMLIGGMIISAEAFERWLEEHLAGMISRHQDLHTDNSGYDE